MNTFITIVKWATIVMAVLVIAIAMFMIGRWTASGTGAAQAAADGDASGETAPERETIYTCPMHPQVREPDPNALCPICGMELVPLEDDGDADDDSELPRLRVSKRAAALMNVQTVPARRAEAVREVRLYGRINYDERRLKTITAWAPGRIDELLIDFTGQQVQHGRPMVKLYSPKLIAAQEELLQALRAGRELSDGEGYAARTAHDSVQAARERLRLLGVSADFIDELETTRTVRDSLSITAPIAGTVTRRLVSEGDYVDVGSPLYDVADLSHVWVDLSVFESDLAWLHVGQAAVFRSPSFPGRTFEGAVSFIDPVVDDRTRSVRARVDLLNDDGRLKPGMFVQGYVRAAMDADGRARQAAIGDPLSAVGGQPESREPPVRRGGRADSHLPLVIPASAPLITGRRAVVYVKLRDTDRPTFEARDVLLGPRAGEQVVVLDGLDDGELVVVNGQFRIDSELQIRGRQSMMQPAPGSETVASDEPAPVVREDHPARKIDPDDIPDAFAAPLAETIEEYLALAHALAQDDAEAAAAFAHALHERLYELDIDLLDSAPRAAWEQLDRDLHDVLHDLLDSPDIDRLRSALEPLTEYVAVMVANFVGDRAGTIYRAHCPMVDDFRGADWLQRERDIANPYFGSQMYRCGEIVGEVRMERHEGMEAPRDQVDGDPIDDEIGDLEFPDEFRDGALAALAHLDEIVGAIGHEHEDHARQAIRRMQDALLALELDALDDAMTHAWLRMDTDILDPLRAMVEADSLDAMRDHLPHLRERVEHARDVLAYRGGDA